MGGGHVGGGARQFVVDAAMQGSAGATSCNVSRCTLCRCCLITASAGDCMTCHGCWHVDRANRRQCCMKCRAVIFKHFVVFLFSHLQSWRLSIRLRSRLSQSYTTSAVVGDPTFRHSLKAFRSVMPTINTEKKRCPSLGYFQVLVQGGSGLAGGQSPPRALASRRIDALTQATNPPNLLSPGCSFSQNPFGPLEPFKHASKTNTFLTFSLFGPNRPAHMRIIRTK